MQPKGGSSTAVNCNNPYYEDIYPKFTKLSKLQKSKYYRPDQCSDNSILEISGDGKWKLSKVF